METERFTAFIQIEQRGEYLLRQSGRHEYIAGGQPLDNPISKLPPQRVIFRQLPIILDLARLIARRYLAFYPIGLLQSIGRASCRERVCQSVYISVVAVSLKQTK